MKSVNPIPIACSLTTTELRDRQEKLLSQFRAAVVEAEELEEGYVFRLLGDSNSISLVAELIAAERECCPFLQFELSAEPDRGSVMLRASGPAGAKEFVRTVIWKPRGSM